MEVPTTGLGVWRALLSSGDRDLIHRATVAIRKLLFIYLNSPGRTSKFTSHIFISITGNLVHFEGPRQTLVEEGGLLSALRETAAGAGLPKDLQELMQAAINEINLPPK